MKCLKCQNQAIYCQFKGNDKVYHVGLIRHLRIDNLPNKQFYCEACIKPYLMIMKLNQGNDICSRCRDVLNLIIDNNKL